MSTPAFNDPVTFLDHGDRPLLVHVRWGDRLDISDPPAYAIVRLGMAGHTWLTNVTLADEGITWVRGHVSEKDESGRALIAYGALSATPRHEVDDSLMNTFNSIASRVWKKAGL